MFGTASAPIASAAVNPIKNFLITRTPLRRPEGRAFSEDISRQPAFGSVSFHQFMDNRAFVFADERPFNKATALRRRNTLKVPGRKKSSSAAKAELDAVQRLSAK
jgi:hypothetical protein